MNGLIPNVFNTITIIKNQQPPHGWTSNYTFFFLFVYTFINTYTYLTTLEIEKELWEREKPIRRTVYVCLMMINKIFYQFAIKPVVRMFSSENLFRFLLLIPRDEKSNTMSIGHRLSMVVGYVYLSYTDYHLS